MKWMTRNKVLQVLKNIPDPDRGGDIVSLGMVKGLQAKDGHVLFSIEVDPQRGPALEPLRQQAEKVVAKVAGVKKVTAVLTAEKQAPSQSPVQAERKVPQPMAQNLLPDVKNIVAVASGKGGVGKSTVAVNLAVALAKQGQKVGIMDADIYGPSVPRMLGLQGCKPEQAGGKLVPLEAHGVKVISVGFLVDEETPMIWRGPMIQKTLMQFMADVDWGHLDTMIVDMPPGTGDAQLTMAQKFPLSGAVIVSTPQDIALLDARKGLEMFAKVSVPVLGIIENMSTFICPNCGHEEHIFGEHGAKAMAEKLRVPFLGEIPLHIDIRKNADEGLPLSESLPESEFTKIYAGIAAQVAEALSGSQISQMA